MSVIFDTASFRDPDGKVFYFQGRVYRCLTGNGGKSYEKAQASGLIKFLEKEGLIVATRLCGGDEVTSFGFKTAVEMVIEQEKVPFLSYPYEWSFEMLRKAALTHLDLMAHLVPRGLIVKDSSAYNYQFFGPNCKLIDIPSIEERKAKEPWLGYTQFCRHFLNPLLIYSVLKLPPHPLLRSNLDGISVEDANALIPCWKQLKNGILLHVWLQALLERKSSGLFSERALFMELPDQKNTILGTVKRIRRLIEHLDRPRRKNLWINYELKNSYTERARLAKQSMIENVIVKSKVNLVYDFGANAGEYSLIAAKHAAYVVAFDSDDSVADHLFMRLLKEKRGNVLPLLMDFTNPSPDQGFAGKECRSLMQRGKPDLIIAYALIHHLRINGNIPFHLMLDWFYSLGAPNLLVEFVPKEDPMVQRLLRNRDDIYEDYNLDAFGRLCKERFKIIEQIQIPDRASEIFWLGQKAVTTQVVSV